MTITPNIKLEMLKDEFRKANREKRELIIKAIVEKSTFYLNEYYDYNKKDIGEKVGYDIQAELIDKALISAPEDIISEITGISAKNLRPLMRHHEEDYFFDCMDVLIKFNEIDELREAMNGNMDMIGNNETKIKIGEIFREFRVKYYKLDLGDIFPIPEEILKECEGMYFKKQCKQNESCVYKEQFK